MGNKTNPNALRLGYIHDWQSKWFSIKDAPALIGEDFKIRNLVDQRRHHCGGCGGACSADAQCRRR